ncbi:SRPBCC domain-containing protein [Streptomyces sp. NBC_00872]|uniref:SRPBCC domain-containing protein n=1 Tax=Streptomyces sp. NBC_00872 TaxID=2903686 RepID=UPI00386AB225|nr:SRPBCC domain-containing protein [Streptomyces sp. NBC_00872]
MEHEVFVPVVAEALRQTLRDPSRVARCVPGLQQDADESAGPLSGRLKVRIGGHTITYRGTLTLAERDGVFTAEGEGAEARGTGSAKLTLALRLTEAADGTTLTFTGGSRVEGRLAELPGETVTAAAHRLLDRFAARLGEVSVPPETPETPEASKAPETEDTSGVDTSGVMKAADTDREPGSADGPDAVEPDDVVDQKDSVAEELEDDLDDDELTDDERTDDELDDDELDASSFEVDVPPSSLDGETISGEGDFLVPDEPPAEAAHARRTMIGRSAEEVDHAPPRGRYAPVPAPDSGSAGATLRWVAPAAALALASAVVVGRALRRRK